jgi:hypothetical protein
MSDPLALGSLETSCPYNRKEALYLNEHITKGASLVEVTLYGKEKCSFASGRFVLSLYFPTITAM